MDERVGRAQRSLAKIADMAGGALDETIEALERIVVLYEKRGKPEKLAEYRARLEAARRAKNPPDRRRTSR